MSMDLPQFSDADRRQLRDIAMRIASLDETPGWIELQKAVEQRIRTEMPVVSEFSEGEAVQIASRMAFISGMKSVIAIVQHNKKLLSQTNQAEGGSE